MSLAKVLCVDDDSDVLEGIEQTLIKEYQVQLASSGAAALECLDRDGPFAVVLSDMRMPGMSGASFLAKACERAPHSVRMLLTGQTDLESAVLAVNEGQIFRFLLKPCAPDQLRAAFAAAFEQHRLLTAERDLLERTLSGSIKALVDALALTSPLAFGRCTRLHKLVSSLCEELALKERWHIEIAALVCELSAISLSDELFERYYYEQPLTPAEQKLVSELPEATRRILSRIPRLEPVLELLASFEKAKRLGGKGGALATAVLLIAYDFDVLEVGGMDSLTALETLESRRGRYDAVVLEAFTRRKSSSASNTEVREIRLAGLREGMVFAEDVRTESGALLAARGYEVSANFATRAMSFRKGHVKEPLRVIVRGKHSLGMIKL